MIKGILLALLYHLGVMRLILFFYRNTIPILMIHGVIDDSKQYAWTPGWERLTTKQLDNGLTILSRYFNFISYDDAIAMLASEIPMKPYSMVLTFDDGYQNNLTHAHPITSKHHAPSMYFIATEAAKHNTPYWIDRLDYALQFSGKEEIAVEIGSVSQLIHISDRALYPRDYQLLRLKLKSTYTNDWDLLTKLTQFLDDFEKKTGKSIQEISSFDDWSRVINENQLSRLPNDISVGSHTVNHVRLDDLELEKLTDEVIESKKNLERIVHKPCIHFCYPNGNYSTTASSILKKNAYKSAVTTISGINKKNANLFTLKRISFPMENKPPRLLYYLLAHIQNKTSAV